MARRRADDDTVIFDLEPDDGPFVPAAPSRDERVSAARRATVRFDLVPDEDADEAFEAVPVPPSRLVLAARAVGARVRSWPRRRVVALAAVVAVLAAGSLTAGVLVTQARHRAWAQVAATTSGAVLDLGHAPVEAARVAVDAPAPVALVGGTLVVQERPEYSNALAELTSASTLHGIDVATGAMRWTTKVAANIASCTAGDAGQAWIATSRVVQASMVVCWSADLRTVVAVDGDGTIRGNRELADLPQDAPDAVAAAGGHVTEVVGSAAHRLLATSDGGLLRIDRIGAPIASPKTGPVATADSSTTLVEPLVTRDVRVRLEDAATGRVRWETVLDSADLPAGTTLDWSAMCQVVATGTSLTQDDPVVEVDATWSDTLTPQRLRTIMCGIDASLDLRTGEVIEQEDVTAPDYAPQWAPMITFPDGGWGELVLDQTTSDGAQDASMRILRDDGSVVGEVPGVVLPPFATDGRSSAILIASALDGLVGQGSGLAAYDPRDASPLWTAEAVTSGRTLVRTADVVVVSDGKDVVGLDRATGAMRWTHELSVPPGATQDALPTVLDALTDGRRAVVVAPVSQQDYYNDMENGETVTTALDLRTGAVVWESRGSGPLPYAIAGHLFRFDDDAVVLLR